MSLRLRWRTSGLNRWLARRRVIECPACGGARQMLDYGEGPRATLVTCSWCTGEKRKLADTMEPTAGRGSDG